MGRIDFILNEGNDKKKKKKLKKPEDIPEVKKESTVDLVNPSLEFFLRNGVRNNNVTTDNVQQEDLTEERINNQGQHHSLGVNSTSPAEATRNNEGHDHSSIIASDDIVPQSFLGRERVLQNAPLSQICQNMLSSIEREVSYRSFLRRFFRLTALPMGVLATFNIEPNREYIAISANHNRNFSDLIINTISIERDERVHVSTAPIAFIGDNEEGAKINYASYSFGNRYDQINSVRDFITNRIIEQENIFFFTMLERYLSPPPFVRSESITEMAIHYGERNDVLRDIIISPALYQTEFLSRDNTLERNIDVIINERAYLAGNYMGVNLYLNPQVTESSQEINRVYAFPRSFTADMAVRTTLAVVGYDRPNELARRFQAWNDVGFLMRLNSMDIFRLER